MLTRVLLDQWLLGEVDLDGVVGGQRHLEAAGEEGGEGVAGGERGREMGSESMTGGEGVAGGEWGG